MIILPNFKTGETELRNLSDINLIVGPNGIGKTTLLQSILEHTKINGMEFVFIEDYTCLDFRIRLIDIDNIINKQFLKYIQIFDSSINDVFFERYLRELDISFIKYNPFNSFKSQKFSALTEISIIILNALILKNGVLLLDNFGGNLSLDTMYKLWNILIEISKMNNLQIFAVVQNMDTIISLNNTEQEINSDHSISLYRLGKSVCEIDEGQLIAIHYNRAEIDTCIRHNIEMR